MSETRTSEWQEICLQAMLEGEPDRRIAILEKLGRILRKDNHEYGPLWADFEHAEVKRNGTPVYLKNLELRLLRYLIESRGWEAVFPVMSCCVQSGAMTVEHLRELWICTYTAFVRNSSRTPAGLN